jgi:hypothetical protein
MVVSSRLAFSAAMGAFELMLLATSCGGDDSATGTPVDSGAMGDSSAAPALDAATNDDVASSMDAGASPSGDDRTTPLIDGNGTLCQAQQRYHQRCKLDSPCQQQNLAACAAQEASLSTVVVHAYSACLEVDSCDLDGGRAMNTACLLNHLAGAMPTEAQKAVAKATCAACRPDAGADCESSFFDVGGEANVNIIGLLILEVNDVTAAKIESTCTGAALADAGSSFACAAQFFTCADRIALQVIPGDACKGDGGG